MPADPVADGVSDALADVDAGSASLQIFSTVGTDHHPFNRLGGWVDAWLGRRTSTDEVSLYSQIGTSDPPDEGGYDRLVPYDEMIRRMATSDIVVCHGGPATVMDARRVGKLPIVVPRESGRGEHVDDHQVRFSKFLERRSLALVATDAATFDDHLDKVSADPSLVVIEPDGQEMSKVIDRFDELVRRLVHSGSRPQRRSLGRRFRRDESTDQLRVLLTCSTGGHLAQLYRLMPWLEKHERRWFTFDKADARSLLADETSVWGHHPTTRNVPNLLRNLVATARVFREWKPDLIISNGAGIAVPAFWLSRLFGVPTVYVEVYDRVDSATLTGRLCQPVTDLFMVQWPEQADLYRNTIVLGQVL